MRQGASIWLCSAACVACKLEASKESPVAVSCEPGRSKACDIVLCLPHAALPRVLACPHLACPQVLQLLLVVGSNTLVRAQEPEGMLWALIQNHIKLMTQPMPPQVKVRTSCVGHSLGFE